MRPYLAHTENALRLLLRNRTALFFTYLMPLVFFFLFSSMLGGAAHGGAMLQVVAVVLTIGVLGNGLFGAGLTLTQEREENILRRFKVTPSGARPILFASLASGLVAYVPLIVGVIALAHFVLHVPIPPQTLAVVVFSAVGLLAFRGIGLLIASTVNSVAEGTAVVQVVYLPMLFLCGATIPLEVLPPWLRTATNFLPSPYLFSGMQSMLLNGLGFWHSAWATLALLVTAAASTFLALKLFRWEKDEAAPPHAKWWIVVGIAPFFLLGLAQIHSQTRDLEMKVQERAMRRTRTFAVENVRVFIGDGRVIDQGRVLVQNGHIAEVIPQAGAPALPDTELINGAGKTLLPGLIDMHIHLGASGMPVYDATEKDAEAHRLMAYLYCGVTAVRSVGDWLDHSLAVRKRVADGELLGAELFAYGPLFTAEGGHGTEYIKMMPENVRAQAREEFLRLPKSPQEATQMVHQLKLDGVDGIKAILQGDFGRTHFVRLDSSIYDAVAHATHAENLPLATHTNTVQDVEEAIAAQSDSIEHGALTDHLPPADLEAMRAKGLAYDPTLTVVAVLGDLRAAATAALDSPLLQQIVPAEKVAGLRRSSAVVGTGGHPELFTTATANLLAAWRAGVSLIAGTDAGNPFVIHGPTVQRELALWVEAGIPASVALQAATSGAARVLRADKRIGTIAPGMQASFILVDGDPTVDIHALDRISSVVFRGEIVRRPDLLDDLKEAQH